MFKSLLARASEAMSSAVTTMWTGTQLEELQHHWRLVQVEHSRLLQVGSSNLSDTELLKASRVREHLEAIVRILRREDKEIHSKHWQLRKPVANPEKQKQKHEREEDYEQDSDDENDEFNMEDVTLGRGHGVVRPCLEFALEERFLDILCALGMADRPAGMMALVLQVAGSLLKHIRQPLIAHVSVHHPLRQLVCVCVEASTIGIEHAANNGGSHSDSHARGISTRVTSSLVTLLEAIWLRIQDDPSQLQFFFEERSMKMSTTNYMSTASATAMTAAAVAGVPENKQIMKKHPPQLESQLLVFSALLPHMFSPRKRTGERSRNALLYAMQLQDFRLCLFVLNNTEFCSVLANGLAQAFDALPTEIDPQIIEQIDAGTFDLISETDGQDKQASQSRKDLEAFLGRIVFCNALCVALKMPDGPDLGENQNPSRGSTVKSLLAKLLRQIEQRFLVATVLPRLLQANESQAATATVYIRLMIGSLSNSVASASPLVSCLVNFLLGDSDEAESRDNIEGVGTSMKTEQNIEECEHGLIQEDSAAALALRDSIAIIRPSLIYRIDSLAKPLSEATIDLFATLLDLNHEAVLFNLVLRNLVDLEYLKDDDREDEMEEDEGESVLSLEQNDRNKSEADGEALVRSITCMEESASNDTPTKKFLANFPGSPMPEGDNVFEEYLTDAQVQSAARLTAYWSPKSQLNSSASPMKRRASWSSPQPAKQSGEFKALGANRCNSRGRRNSSSSVESTRRSSVRKLLEEGRDLHVKNVDEDDDEEEEEREQDMNDGEFFEGLFLYTIFNKLERLLDQSLDENLILTGILSRLLQCPHSILHSFLMETTCNDSLSVSRMQATRSEVDRPFKEGVRTLRSVLQEVWDEAKRRSHHIADFDERLQMTRINMGVVVDRGDQEESMTQFVDDFASEHDPHRRFLQAYVLMEEFLKEVASIVEARYKLSGLANTLSRSM